MSAGDNRRPRQESAGAATVRAAGDDAPLGAAHPADEDLHRHEALTVYSSAAPSRSIRPSVNSDAMQDLRTLLLAYSHVLDAADPLPLFLWARLERPRLLRWLPVPAAGALVRALVVRHVRRRITVLKRVATRRVALAQGGPGPSGDLKMLEHFEQSLPSDLRARIVVPLALLGVLFVAYVLANFGISTPAGSLLADLTTATFELDRGAAVDAFRTNDLGAGPYFATIAIIAWSVTLVILPLLPAFSAARRLLAEASTAEARAFAAVGTRSVHDVQVDLIAEASLILPVAVLGIALPLADYAAPAEQRDLIGSWIVGTLAMLLAVIAAADVWRRYSRRRAGIAYTHGRLMRATLLVTCTLSLLMLAVALSVN